MRQNYLRQSLRSGLRNLSLGREWDCTVPAISRQLRANCRMLPHSSVPGAIRKVIYTTNAIESLNSIITHA
ncbi:transposase [Escherichia coli]|nr:transposase [Escherichia coli]